MALAAAGHVEWWDRPLGAACKWPLATHRVRERKGPLLRRTQGQVFLTGKRCCQVGARLAFRRPSGQAVGKQLASSLKALI